MSKNVFMLAARQALRFESTRGQLTTEQLFSLPLTAKDERVPSLNAVAININRNIRDMGDGEESFVAGAADPAKDELKLKLDVVKEVIRLKQEENAEQMAKRNNAEERHRILEALAEKKNESLKSASEEELMKRLAEIG